MREFFFSHVSQVLLIKPKFFTALGILVDEIPIGLEYIASAIEKTTDKVVIADEGHDHLNLAHEIRKLQPDYVGISCQMAWHNEIARIARLVKKISPHTSVIAGGYYPSLFPQLLQFIPEIDYIVTGEGEEVFKEICEKGLNDPYKIQGLVFKDGKQLRSSGSHPHIQNLNMIKFPARYLRRSPYFHMQLPGRRYDVLTTTRGCIGKCSYCCEPQMNGGPRRRSVENVSAELDELVVFNHHQPLQICITDPNFMGRTENDVEWIDRFCDFLSSRQYDLSFSVLVRADMVVHHPLLVRKMVENHFKFFELGIESPDPKILHSVKKGESVTTITNAVKIINEAQGFALGTLMIGFPNQTAQNIRQYPQYAKFLGLREAAFAISTPLAGTSFFYDIKNRIFEKNLRKFTYLHPTFTFNPELTKNAVMQLLGYCYGGFYSPSQMARNEEFYQKLIPNGYKTNLMTYFHFLIQSLKEFSYTERIQFVRGALTGYFAQKNIDSQKRKKE